MSFLGRKRRAGRTTLLAADLNRTPFAAFHGVGVVLVALILGVLGYEWLRHRNNELLKQNNLLVDENQRLEQQIIRSKSAKSNLTSPNNQFLDRLRGLSLERVSPGNKRTIPRQTLMAWYDKAVWDQRDEDLGVPFTVPAMADSGVPSIDPVTVAMGRNPSADASGIVLE